MDKLKRDIHLYLCINHHRDVKVGGKRRYHKLMYNGHIIYYNSYQNEYGDKNTVVFNGGRDAGRRPCFSMTIENNTAILQSLERGKDCFEDKHDRSKDLVHVAFQIAKENGCTSLELTDNSSVRCPPYRFHLSNQYFLTTGQTWYESILPISIKEFSESEMATYRNRAKKNNWITISKYLTNAGVNLDFISTEGIDINKTGSATFVLNRIKDMKNDISCKFFAEHTNKILIASKIPSFYGTSWIYKE